MKKRTNDRPTRIDGGGVITKKITLIHVYLNGKIIYKFHYVSVSVQRRRGGGEKR